MMKKIFRLVLAVLVAFGCTPNKSVQEYPIMGNLSIGVYPVGFKTLFTYDETKKGIPYADWDGRLYNHYDPQKGRQHQINIWYPAIKNTGGNLTYEHYVNLMGRQTNFDWDMAESSVFAQEQYLSKVNDLGVNGTFTADMLNELLQLNVISKLDADQKSGSFPVVVFPNGSSPAFQSITCEFLASHGYIVVAFAPKGRFSSALEVSSVGLETAVDDLEFVLSQIGDLASADMGNISLVANAISSSICVAAMSRNQKIKGVISLEGGFLSQFEQGLLAKSVFYQPENIQAPILMIYAPHPSIDPKFTYHLKFADRFYAHFPDMSEFVMLNFGMFDSFIDDIIGKHEGNTQAGFELANALMLRFLNKCTKNDELELFSPEIISKSTEEIDTTFVLEGLKPTPSIAVLKNLFIEKGIEGIDKVYQQLTQEGNDTPFSEAFYYEFKDWLAWKKDPDFTSRHQMFKLAYASYPDAPKVNYYLAYYAQQVGDIDQANAHYTRAINLLDMSELAVKEKDLILRYSEEGLRELLAL